MGRNALDRMATATAETGKAVEAPQLSALEQRQQSLARLVKQMTPEIAAALPAHLTPERLARIVTTVMRRTPSLAKCDQASFIGAVMTCAQLGLEPGPTGQAYLVPYGNECTFILGYRGMLELARRSGQVETIYARPVYELDKFHVQYGLDEQLTHEPYMDGDGGELKYVYAVAKYKNGGHNIAVMSRSAVDKIRARSRAGKSGPWVTDYEAMALKTVVRQLAKWMPQSVEFQTALAVEGKVRISDKPEALDELAADPNVIDVEPVSGPPAEMDPETGEVPADVGDGQEWPEVAKAGGES